MDQVFVKNLQVTGAIVNEGYYDQISDHKCLKVTLKIDKGETSAYIAEKSLHQQLAPQC